MIDMQQILLMLYENCKCHCRRLHTWQYIIYTKICHELTYILRTDNLNKIRWNWIIIIIDIYSTQFIPLDVKNNGSITE
jgi:hypothetical protein